MGRTLIIAFLVASAGGVAVLAGSRAQGNQRAPVIVELFTSEGCSSCPPADALLIRLEQLQPVANAQIIVLGQHVDYWDRLGWSDPFSSAQFSRRQSEYAEAFRQDGIYTPQMIVDGQVEFNGSDGPRAQSAITRAAAQPKIPVRITSRKGTQAHSLRVSVEVGAIPSNAAARDLDVILVVTESNLSSAVPRGENAGRQLQHTGVVRLLKPIGRVDAPKTLEAEIQLPTSWREANLTLVAFLQGRTTRRIVGAGTARLPTE